MSFYLDEESVYKCPKHPSKRRSSCGVCPACLTDRLSALCPDCAHARPCVCSATSSSPSSSSSSRFSSDGPLCAVAVVRVAALIAGEPAYRRSRSVAAVPFVRSRFAVAPPPENLKKSSVWYFFKSKKDKLDNEFSGDYDKKNVMMRSRSVAVGESATPSKGKGWYFPSPMKAFRKTKTSKVVQERSPLYRG